ncbi:unnamed protein product [Prunus armeniaca]
MRVSRSSSAKIKCLVSTNNKEVNGMQEVWDILLKFLPELLKSHDLPYKKAAEKQGLGHLR